MRKNREKAIHIIRRTLGNHSNFLHIVPADWETSLLSLIFRSNLMKDHKKFAWFLFDHFHTDFQQCVFCSAIVRVLLYCFQPFKLLLLINYFFNVFFFYPKGLNKGTKQRRFPITAVLSLLFQFLKFVMFLLVVICLITFTIFSWPFKPFTSSFTRLTRFTVIA